MLLQYVPCFVIEVGLLTVSKHLFHGVFDTHLRLLEHAFLVRVGTHDLVKHVVLVVIISLIVGKHLSVRVIDLGLLIAAVLRLTVRTLHA